MSSVETLMKQLGIDKEHKGKIEEVTKYMQEHRIQELFNVSAQSFFRCKKRFVWNYCNRLVAI